MMGWSYEGVNMLKELSGKRVGTNEIESVK